MVIRKHSDNYNFVGNQETGITFRWGKTIKEDPKSAPWPELADISISNHCSKQCSFCYRNSRPDGSFMSFSDYKFVLDNLSDKKWGKVFQVALGGGEPTEHPDFIKILKITREKGMIPNYTTNGEFVSDDILRATKKFCGAVAISVNDSLLGKKKLIKRCIDRKIKVNLHFILSNQSIDKAIEILNGNFDSDLIGVNSIIFLTYKPFGRATEKGILKKNDSFNKFLELIDKPKTKLSFGFDACFVPVLMKYTFVNKDFIDSCECGFFSVYVDEKLNVKPCSFTNNDNFTVNLKDKPFKEIWQDSYEKYRQGNTKVVKCKNCPADKSCRGGCPYFPKINLCQS